MSTKSKSVVCCSAKPSSALRKQNSARIINSARYSTSNKHNDNHNNNNNNNNTNNNINIHINNNNRNNNNNVNANGNIGNNNVNIVNKKYKSPFKSFITTGVRVRNRQNDTTRFDYHLSNDERNFVGKFNGPMKTVPAEQRELLTTGQRSAYLQLRYEHSPDRKYNYPEATSWRIGWFHNQQTKGC